MSRKNSSQREASKAVDDEVGYRRPPKEHRFKPGCSGNPRGRPRKVVPPPPSETTAYDAVDRFLQTPIAIEINGVRREMHPMEAALRHAYNGAIKGSPRDLLRFLEVLAKLKAFDFDASMQAADERVKKQIDDIVEADRVRMEGIWERSIRCLKSVPSLTTHRSTMSAMAQSQGKMSQPPPNCASKWLGRESGESRSPPALGRQQRSVQCFISSGVHAWSAPASRHMAGHRARTIVQTLAAEVAQGAFRVGDRFPTESELGERFGVGRHTVREALKRLTEQGMIGRRRKADTFVLASNRR